MGLETAQANLEKVVRVDGNLTPEEITATKEALMLHKSEVIGESKELRKFIIRDYAKLSYERVGKEGVADFQRYIQQQDASIVVDGDFGPQTLASLVQFQIKHHLTPDGILGPITLEKLNANPPQVSKKPEAPKPPQAKGESVDAGKEEYLFDIDAAVKYIEKEDTEKLSKIFKCENDSREIAKAVALYQKVNNLYVDGKPGDDTLEVKGNPENEIMTAKEIKDAETPKKLKDIENLFFSLTPESLLEGFPGYTKKLKESLREKAPKLIKQAQEGFKRLTKNIEKKGLPLDAKTPMTIYVCDTEKRTHSTAFTFNPFDKKIHTFPIGYGQGGISQEDGSLGTPTGSFKIGEIRIAKDKYGHSAIGKAKSPRGATMDTIGIEGKNDNTGAEQGRGAYTHGVSAERSQNIYTGVGSKSHGCRVMTAEHARWLANIYKKAGRGYEEVSTI